MWRALYLETEGKVDGWLLNVPACVLYFCVCAPVQRN